MENKITKDEEEIDKLSNKEIYKRIFQYFLPYKSFLIIGWIILILAKMIEAIIPITLAQIIQIVLDNFNSSTSEKEKLFHIIWNDTLFLLSAVFLGYLFENGILLIKNVIGQKVIYKMRTEVYEHIIRMPVAYFDKHPVGDLVARSVQDIDQINQMLSESIIPIFGNIILFICIFTCITILDLKLAILLLFLLPIIIKWMFIAHRYQSLCIQKARKIFSSLNIFLQEYLMGAMTIRNFGLEKIAIIDFEKINKKYKDILVENKHYLASLFSKIEFIQNFAFITSFVLFIIFLPSYGGFATSYYLAFIFYILMLFRPLADFVARYNSMQFAIAASRRLFNFVDLPTEQKKDLGTMELQYINQIVFDNVWFAYENENWILQGISFTVEKGKSIALVGKTGEGKSTIINLLLRFYEPHKGSIKINNIDIHSYTLASLRNQFSLVLQDPVLFSGSIFDNLGLFNSNIQKDKIGEILNNPPLNAYFSPIFSKDKNKLIGRGGENLSVGEKQLLSIMRAIVYKRSMFIFDEATANIDTITENLIQETLKRILPNSTALVIAHRLSTIKAISHILVLQDGKIIESGTHDELIQLQGVYEKLNRLQLSNI